MRKPLALISQATLYLWTAAAVLAQTGTGDQLQAPAGAINDQINPTSIPQLIVNLLFMLAAFLAVAYLMYGGIKWITSRGDKVAVESARKHIAAAVIGLIVVAGSFFILQVVFTILGADNPLKKGFVLPTLAPAGTTP